MSKLIAVVEDEPDIAELITLHLKKAGFRAEEFREARSFLKYVEKNLPDLVLLDLMLPDADGFEICQYLRKTEKLSAIPIIMVTAKSEETDRIIGLELGADDYVTKPFSVKELVARIKAVLRRRGPEEKSKISFDNLLVIDSKKHEVLVEGKGTVLTSTEFKILELLASRPGWVFTRHQILDDLWGHDKIVLDRTVDVHVRNLREKLGPACRLIKNIRSVGYKLEE